MIFNLLKKQLLLAIRNRQDLLILLVMPLVLIVIIKSAVGDMMTSETPTFEATIALAEHSVEEHDIEKIREDINLLPIPDEAKEEILTSIEEFKPVEILKEQVFGNKEIQKMLTLEKITPEEIEKAQEEEKYDAIIEIPEGFSYDLLQSAIHNQTTVPAITLYANKGEELVFQIVNDLLLVYEEQMNTNTVLSKHGLADLVVTNEDIQGKITSISKVEPITATLYYAVGMAVMFVLYIAANMGSYAFDEKRIHVFDRIILAHISRWTFFSGTFFGGAVLAFIQLMIIFGFSALVYGVRWTDLSQFVLISGLLSFAVGGLATLLTAINYRVNSETASSVFGNAIVSIIAFLGGSFFPVGNFSNLLEFIGNVTPNGASMTAYLMTAQGYGLADISNHIIYLVGFTVVMVFAAILLTPKRGQEV